MENYEIVRKIEDFSNRILELKKAVKIDDMKHKITDYEKLSTMPDFYSDMNKAQKVLKEIKELTNNLNLFSNLNSQIEDLKFYFDLLKKEEEDVSAEIEELIPEIETSLSNFEIKMLLSKEYDNCDAIFELHPGAGGTESQDWTEILFRMYRRYAENNNYEFEILDYIDGEEAGIKSVTFIIKGEKAYGYLKGEQGVHRLVRISPFDSNARRHTSFCGCTVTPQIENDVNIEIKPEDIRIDTYRSSGAGGQHVNTTDSAVRITHIKTGIVVSCQNERSQIQNRERALNILKSKLYQLEREEQERKIKAINGESSDNSFGSQIRSYVFHPYSMIKDHRTNYESYNVDSIMNGEIDGFINAYLKSDYNVR